MPSVSSTKDTTSVIFAWKYVLITFLVIYSIVKYMIPDVLSNNYYVFINYCVPLVIEMIKQNQFMQVLLLGSISASLYHGFNIFYRIMILPLFSGLNCSIIIHNSDPNFNAVIDYISDNLLINSAGAKGSLQANTKPKSKSRKDYIAEWMGTAVKTADELIYRPDNDQVIHRLSYKNRIIFLERSKSSNPIMGKDKPFTPESLKLSCWGQDNSILKELLLDAIQASIKQQREDTISIYTLCNDWCSQWMLAMTKKARSKESVILDMDDMEVLLDDARNFLNNGKWYSDMGIPYRRGYMLYGPPGCGKTSFAQVLAGELHLDLCILNLNHKGLTDTEVAELLRDAPQKSIIVLEDIDAIFVERSVSQKHESDSGISVSFSGLLNALDGIASQEGRLLFMTTNHIEKLDSALIRPGRCDIQLELKLASKIQMEKMFLRFFPNEYSLAQQFAASLPAYELSMATLQGYFLKSRNSSKLCLERVNELLHSSRPTKSLQKSLYDHLKRVGLEKYTTVFEFNGIITTEDLSAMKVSDLLLFSIDLQYDPHAIRLLTILTTSNNKSFMEDSYSLAEVTHIREYFLAAYADIACKNPHQQSSSSSTATTICNSSKRRLLLYECRDDRTQCSPSISSSEEDLDKYVIQPHNLTDPNNHTNNAISSTTDHGVVAAAGTIIDQSLLTPPNKVSVDELNQLSKELCKILSKGGKGVISLYNLQRLIDIHPLRPKQCVEAANAFTNPHRTIEEEVLQSIDLYRFLKRLGLASSLYIFKSQNIFTIRDLFNIKVDKISDSIKTFTQNYGLTTIKAYQLAEVLFKTTSDSGNLMNFSLHSRQRVMKAFYLFYATKDSSATLRNTSNHYNTSSNTSLHSDCSTKLEDVDDCISSTDCTSNNAIDNYNHHQITTISNQWLSKLEILSYEFSLLCTDKQGRGLVSLIEIYDYLDKYQSDPYQAIYNTSTMLVNPLNPIEPPIIPKEILPKEWIDEWIESILPEIDLRNYINTMKKQGFHTKNDFNIPLFTMEDLEKYFNIDIYADRRKLISIHQKLLQEF